ncbi:hypothetical protein Mapa_015238 [Marchantia paleacea]|nr:hypothetical protein Mapa_015238 [Marchantia paleacea]
MGTSSTKYRPSACTENCSLKYFIRTENTPEGELESSLNQACHSCCSRRWDCVRFAGDKFK